MSHIKHFYVFIDTNLLYNNKIDYNIFETYIMKYLLEIRDSINTIFEDSKKISYYFAEMVCNEAYSITKEQIKIEFEEFVKKIEYIDEKKLKDELNEIITNLDQKINEKKDKFILDNEIIIVPHCNSSYFQNIIEKAIDKKLPFKPKYNQKKKRYVGDNGFKDAVIWYSIIDYIKDKTISDKDHIILLTNNKSDFESEEMLREFEDIVRKEIHVIDVPNVKDSKFSEFINLILKDSKHIKIDSINISYLNTNNNVRINSIEFSPLDFNISSIFNNNFKFSKFKDDIENEITAKLKKLFNVDNLKFNYTKLSIEYVNVHLRNYKSYFYDIYNIELGYDDGTTVYVDGSDKQYFDIGQDEESDIGFKDEISSNLEGQGYGPIDLDIIEYEIVESISP